MTRPRELVIGTGAFVLLAAVVYPLSYLGFDGAMIPLFLLGTAAIVGLPVLGGWRLFAAGLLATAGVGAGAMAFIDYRAAGSGPAVTLATPADAGSLPDAAVFTFENARLLADMRGTYTRVTVTHIEERRRLYRTFVVRPLVGPDWKPGDPVPVWAGCVVGQYGCRDRRIREGRIHAMRVPPREADGYRAAVAHGRRAHGLQPVAGAPVLRLVASPDGHAETLELASWAAPAGAWLLWLTVFGVSALATAAPRQ